MPISEDEFEIRIIHEAEVTMSKAELRKTHKPIMEKKRRARINQCLNEIKSLILEAMNKDPARHSKLEKADILEMAVKHLQNVQRQQLAIAMANDPSVLRKFKTGFNECATEIDRYVSQADGVDTGLKERINSHLQKCIGGIEQVAHFNFPGFSNFGVFGHQEPSNSGGDQNNNAGIQIPQSIQLIPSRLPTGEIALLVPNSSNLPFFSNLSRDRPSAFAAVIPASSSPVSPRGFRPVQPAKAEEQSQVQQVSSTNEIKSMKYPIHPLERKILSPRKPIEPLCIITNQGERFKQAQQRENSAEFVENRLQGVKRKFSELNQGLLTVAEYPAPKMFKNQTVTSNALEQEPSTSRDHGEGSSDMWRPW